MTQKLAPLTWFIGEVKPHQEGSVSFSVDVTQDAPNKSEIINFATVYFPSVPEATRTNGTVNRVITVMDNIAPTTTAVISPSANLAGWSNSDVTVTLTATDNPDGSGAPWNPGTDYNNPEHKKNMLESVTQMVLEFKDEPYILFWLLGNENVYKETDAFHCNRESVPGLR